ncbi:MAG: TIGR02186 family protein [Acidobacteriaceae bacterium]
MNVAKLFTVHHRTRLLALSLALGAGATTIAAATVQMPPPTLVPDKIAMNTFYAGARVRIEGTAPSRSGIVVVIRGNQRDEFFNRKGRIGFLWLNTDRIHIKRVPSVFLTFSSTDASALLDRAGLDENQLDETAIVGQMRCHCHCKCSLTDPAKQTGAADAEPEPAYKQLLHADILSLKQHEGSYAVKPRSVSLTEGGSSGTHYTLQFQWPLKAPPGDYRVEVYACREHKVIARSVATLQLVEVGFPASLQKLASRYPWIYGAGAVLAAMLAGFGTDALVRLRRRKGAAGKQAC